MTTLLHIGHNKTGSSAIQSFLALNAGRLEAFGWTYPDDPGLAAARAGEISIGNLGAFRQFRPGTASGNTLFSSELLFFSLAADSEDFEQLLALGPDCRVLIFTRDLFGYLLSHWGQEIKRGGVTAGVVETVLKERIYAKLLKLLARFDDHGIAYRVRNYSPHSRDIFRAFLSELMPGQEAAFLEGAAIPSHLVNRGLTLAEYEVQRLFNLYLPRVTTFPFVSDRVVNELPDIPSERPVLPDDVVGEVQRQNAADAEALNALLPEGEAVSLDYDPGSSVAETGTYTFSAEQLDVLVRGVSDLVRHHAATSLSDTDAEALRDAAMTYETGAALSREQAIALMGHAARARPGGALIRRKLKEWQAGG